MIVGDEQIFRELKDRFGSPYGFGVYFRGGMGAEAFATCSATSTSTRSPCRSRHHQDVEGPEAAAGDQAAQGRRGFIKSATSPSG